MDSPSPRTARRWVGGNPPLVAAALATFLMVGAAAFGSFGRTQVPGLESLELMTIDLRARLVGSRPPADDRIVILGVDDRTRAKFPETFQTRRGWARLLTAVDALAPKVIALDLFFSSPERILRPTSLAALRSAREALASPPELSEREALIARSLAVIDEETRGDEVLAAAIKASGRVILGVMFFFDGPPAVGAPAPPGIDLARYDEAGVAAAPASRRPPQASDAVGALPAIAAGARSAGAVNLLRDVDGTVRRVYGVVEFAGHYHLPLGMVVALEALGAESSYVVGDEFIGVGDRRLPASARGELLPNYLAGRRAFPVVSAADVLDGTVDPASLRDKLVFVGFTDAARDKIATPLAASVDGVELHATLAHNILHQELLRSVGPWFAVMVTLMLGLALTLAQARRVRRRRTWVAPVVAAAAALLYAAAAQLAYGRGLVLPVVQPLSATVVIAFVTLAVALATEGREKARLRSAFSQYVNESLVASIVADPDRARLGGERRDLTVLFSDIRGFSRFSETLEPEQLSSFLNEYLTPMTEIVLGDGGMLDKYIGDAVMAVYGAPLALEDHADRACHTALTMIAALAPLNRAWKARGLPEIAIGIGLNTGAMAVGNMGSDTRFDYTVIGDSVNLGARLESLTKEYEVPILCGEATAKAARGHLFRELDFVRVTGRDAVARIYQLIGPRSGAPAEDALEAYAAALDAYRARDWDRADRLFAAFLADHPGDGPATVMRGRIAKLRSEPPAAHWDGVFSQRSK